MPTASMHCRAWDAAVLLEGGEDAVGSCSTGKIVTSLTKAPTAVIDISEWELGPHAI